jgi:branched-chain amino acid transport system substrate-binding protein
MTTKTLLATTCWFAASVLGSTPAGQAAEKVFRLGVQAPLTGPAAQTGREFKGSVEMAFEKIGYRLGDYRVELVWIDCQSDPAKAVSAYSEAVERGGIQAAILNWHSSVAVALMDVAAQYRVPHFFPFGSTELVNRKFRSDPKKYDYWGGKGWPVPAKLMVSYADCLDDAAKRGLWKPKNRLVAVYGEDTDWGRGAGASLRREFERRGWKVASEDYFPTTQTDFYPLLGKYRKLGPAVVAGTTTSVPAMTALVKQAGEVGLDAALVADGLGWMGDWYKLTGPASNGVLDMIPRLSSPAAKVWADAVRRKHGYEPSPSAGGLSYDFTNFFIKAAKRCLQKYGRLDRESLHRILVDEVDTGKLTFGTADGALVMREYRYGP